MPTKEEQVKFKIWNKMKENGFTTNEIADNTGFDFDEVNSFFNR